MWPLLVAISRSESDVARTVIDTVRAYRERMADYGSMRALEVWYDMIDVERVLKEVAREEDRSRIARRIEKARAKSVPDYIFPKLADQQGTTPLIIDNPPLIFHPTREQAPGLVSGYSEAFAAFRESLPEHTRTLLDRYSFCDLAIKVVGVGSVGTWCGVALFLAADNDPIFLQVKEAKASVLEPYVDKSVHENHGQRVVVGQRLMQSASDIFLGWAQGLQGRHFYLRQFRGVKLSPIQFLPVGRLYNSVQYFMWMIRFAHQTAGRARYVRSKHFGGDSRPRLWALYCGSVCRCHVG